MQIIVTAESIEQWAKRAEHAATWLRLLHPNGTWLAVRCSDGSLAGERVGAEALADPDADLVAAVYSMFPNGIAVYAPAAEHDGRATGWTRSAATATLLRGLWADIDIVGPAHPSAECPDHDAALRALEALPYAPSILVDTGHGVQALWLLADPLPLPDRAARERAAALLTAWTEALRASGVPADAAAGKDLARLLRVPGFANLREGLTPVWTRLLRADGPRHRLDDLQRWAESVAPPAAAERRERGKGSGSDAKDAKAWAVALRGAHQGERHNVLRDAILHYANMTDNPLVLSDIAALLAEKCDPPYGRTREEREDLERIVHSALEKVAAETQRPGPARLSEVTPERVEYLWRPWLIRGKVEALYGDTGQGKTFVAVDLAARLTRRGEWPDGTPVGQAGDVLYLTREDGLADTLVPRAMAAGADLRRFHAVGPETGMPARVAVCEVSRFFRGSRSKGEQPACWPGARNELDLMGWTGS